MFVSLLLFSAVLLNITFSAGEVELLIPNIALNGETTQSSTWQHGHLNGPDEAHYAIDGNTRTNLRHSGDRCAHTQEEYGAWWKVDLKDEYEIEKVALTGRNSTYADRLQRFYIDVSNNADMSSAQNCAYENEPFTPSETRVYTCPNPIKGRYVRIRFVTDRRSILTLCEVQVQAFPACSDEDDCSNYDGTTCVTDYCQPPKCTRDDQCVHGQICSQNERCNYRRVVSVEEGIQGQLKVVEPAKSGVYQKIVWYKGRRQSDKKIAVVNHSSSDQPQYFNEYCSENSPCRHSNKGLLHSKTGDMTINSVQIKDEDYYYYEFSTHDRLSRDTGEKYEIKVDVYVKPQQEDLKLEVSESEMQVDLTCSMNRIKPTAAEMFFTIGGQRYNGTFVSTMNADQTETNSLTISLPASQATTVKCTVVPVYGERLSQDNVFVTSSSNTQTGVIIGVVIAVIVVVSITAVIIIVIRKRCRHFATQRNNPQPYSATPVQFANVSATAQSDDYEYLKPVQVEYAKVM